MVPRVVGLLEEAQKEAEEDVAEAEVINFWGGRDEYWGQGTLISSVGVYFI